MTVTPLKSAIKDSALTFLSGIVSAKEEGKPLPPLVDKIAGMVIQGKSAGKDLAIAAAKEESIKQFPWLLVAVLGLTVIIMVFVAIKNR